MHRSECGQKPFILTTNCLFKLIFIVEKLFYFIWQSPKRNYFKVALKRLYDLIVYCDYNTSLDNIIIHTITNSQSKQWSVKWNGEYCLH